MGGQPGRGCYETLNRYLTTTVVPFGVRSGSLDRSLTRLFPLSHRV